MALWRNSALLVVCLGVGCTVGGGEGSLRGLVWDPDCHFEAEPFEFTLHFFAADTTEEILEIRVQRDSGFEDASDGANITVRDATTVKESLLGQPIALGEGSLVDLNLYLNAKCPVRFSRPPINYRATSGSVVFDTIYAPQVASSEKNIDLHFEDVMVDDGQSPETRHATVSGDIHFRFSRGRPAQRFP